MFNIHGCTKKINLKYINSSLNKLGYVGYCLTYFFFSFFFQFLVVKFLLGVLYLIFSIVTFRIFKLVILFLYDKQYTICMLTTRWELSDTKKNMQLARLKLGIVN